MRSGDGTKSGEPSRVTLSTNLTMDCLAAPSFQEGSGSAANPSGGKHSVATSAIATGAPGNARVITCLQEFGPHPRGVRPDYPLPLSVERGQLFAGLLTASMTWLRLKLPGFWRGG